MQHGLGDFQTPDHSARIGLDQLAPELGQSHEVQRLLNATLALGAANTVELGGKVEIFPAGESAIRGEHLGHVTDHPSDLGRSLDDIEAGHRRGAFGRLEHSGQHFYDGGLAGTVWSQEAKDGAVGHVQGDVIGGSQVAEAAREDEGLDGEGLAPGGLRLDGVGYRDVGRRHRRMVIRCCHSDALRNSAV